MCAHVWVFQLCFLQDPPQALFPSHCPGYREGESSAVCGCDQVIILCPHIIAGHMVSAGKARAPFWNLAILPLFPYPACRNGVCIIFVWEKPHGRVLQETFTTFCSQWWIPFCGKTPSVLLYTSAINITLVHILFHCSGFLINRLLNP